ncbi:proton-conducting transporter membrane subunit [Thermodesulfobacterium hveragerdense]|uniref:proton-conducting transporter transmembrane domain-containing protein n=1 Tax=Thermodesulfobacterium hveragerdense TaxID=53424 RepID=UPI000414E96B|nr:proton-conducting transporter membrane subunit [Thermodesulfobacterium hveragerdense]
MLKALAPFLTIIYIAITFLCGVFYLRDFNKKLMILLCLVVLTFSNLFLLWGETSYGLFFDGISVIALLTLFWVLGYKEAFKILGVIEISYLVLLILGKTVFAHTPEGIVLLVIAFFLKLAVFPLFLWLPIVVKIIDAITAGFLICIFEIVDFVLLWRTVEKASWFPQFFENLREVSLYIGFLTLLLGAVLALCEKNLKKLLAYATIDDTGYLLIGLSLFSPVSLYGTIILWINHLIAKLGLFFIAYRIEKNTSVISLGKVKGLAKDYPGLAFSFLVFALTLIGIPILPGFWGKLFLYQEVFKISKGLFGLMILGGCLTLVYFIRAYHSLFLGEKGPETVKTPLPKLDLILVMLLSFTIVLGCLIIAF